MDLSTYSAHEKLRDGTKIEIRAIRPRDEAEMLGAIERTSAQSLQRRFFSAKRHFSDRERRFFLDVDFHTHVAIVAIASENGRPVLVGGARFVAVEGEAEMAFAVTDAWQGRGIGSLLMRHLVQIARHLGLKRLTASVLVDNDGMLKLFDRSGFRRGASPEPYTVAVSLALD